MSLTNTVTLKKSGDNNMTTRRDLAGYGIAVVSVVVTLGITRLTWPFFARAPFFPVFGAIFIASQWLPEGASLLALVIATVGATLMAPPGAAVAGPAPWMVAAFAAIAITVNRLLAGRNRVAAALGASEGQFRQLFRDNPQAMWVYDIQDGRFLAVNDAAVARYGYTAAEFQALTLPDLVEVERHTKIDAVHSSARHRTKDGRVIDVQVDGHLVQWSGRNAQLELVHDVTERAQLRAQLSQSQKMEAIGQLAGGIAHDFNNPLTTIQGYADLLLTQIGPDKPMWQDLHEIQAAATSAGMLTHQLLAFSRRQTSNLTAVDVNGVVARLSQMLRRVIPADIEVQVALGDESLVSKVDASGLEQVLMNLVLNARDAIRGKGGRISIRTTLTTIGPGKRIGSPENTASTGRPNGGSRYVVVEVADNGSGMDAVTKARVFEPFFTTKTAGMGTGLGLAVVYGIVQQAGGHLEVESAVGVGTTFRAFLPWTDEPVHLDADRRAAPESMMGSETILIVEDSTELRLLAGRVLRRHGYRVHETGTADGALALAQQADVTVDFILMDVVLPRMSGPEVLTHLRVAWPRVVVLYMSGHQRDELAQRGIRTDDAELLAKPFSAVDLLTSVRRLIDRPSVSKP